MNLLNSLISESEQDRIELDEDMRLLPWQERQRDYKIAEMISYAIRDQLRKKQPLTLRFASRLAINALSSELSQLVGRYQVAVMPYESLEQAWRVQGFELECIGIMSKKNYFALIHEEARIIGVYIPKTRRQMKIERMLNEAFKDLDEYFERKKVNQDLEIRKIIESYLWNVNYEKTDIPLKIRAIKVNLKGECDVRYTSHYKKVQLLFVEDKNTLYYHIA